MKQEAILKKIGVILEELNEQYEYITQHTAQLSELELDLFLANASFLADHIQIIKKIHSNQSNAYYLPIAPEKVAEIKVEEIQAPDELEMVEFIAPAEIEQESPPIVAIEEEITPNIEEIEEEIFKLDPSPATFEFILNDHSEQEKFEFEEKSVDEIFNRPLSGEEERIIAEKKKLSVEAFVEEELEEEVGPEPFLVIKEETLPIVEEELFPTYVPAPPVVEDVKELIADEPLQKPTLNEILAGRAHTNQAHTDKPAITDLKQAINLNDKLLYIKDLFNGYNLAYAEAIEIANKLPNFEAADNFFQKNYAVKNNWAYKQATVDQFYELLNQRFKTTKA